MFLVSYLMSRCRGPALGRDIYEEQLVGSVKYLGHNQTSNRTIYVRQYH